MASVWDKLWKVGLGLWVVGAVCVLLVFRSFSIPSGSMIPTLHPGDYIIVSKMAYGISRYSLPFHPDLFRGRIFGTPPQRGDVAVFKLPRDTGVDYIKRVIGLPGDTIQMKEGRLYINGTIVPREPITKVVTEDYYGKPGEVPTYRETLPNGVKYAVIEIQGDTGFNDNTEAFKIPADNYFVLGDNRDNSTDSRIVPDQGGVGMVPYENFVGRAEVIFISKEEGQQTFPLRRIH